MKRIFLLLICGFSVAAALNATIKILYEQRLTSTSNDEISRPAWYPDGQSIVVNTKITGEQNGDLYRYDASSGNQINQLTDYPYNEVEPTISSSGTRIVFAMVKGAGVAKRFFKVGAGDTPIFDISDTTADMGEPFFYGNNQIYFSSTKDADNYNLWVWDELTGSITSVLYTANFPGDERSPAVSPDGNWLAYKGKSNAAGSSSSDTDWEIYLLNISSKQFPITDVNAPIQLTDNKVNDEDPRFSPDGKYIVYTSETTDGGRDIYIMSIDDKTPMRITSMNVDEFAPAWSPQYSDGTSKIAFLRTNEYSRNDVWLITLTDIEKPLKIINADQIKAYPNPYFLKEHSYMYFKYELLYPATVTIKIFDLGGGLVNDFAASSINPENNGNIGNNKFQWDGKNGDGASVASGIYLYRIDAKSGSTTDKYIGKFVVLN